MKLFSHFLEIQCQYLSASIMAWTCQVYLSVSINFPVCANNETTGVESLTAWTKMAAGTSLPTPMLWA